MTIKLKKASFKLTIEVNVSSVFLTITCNHKRQNRRDFLRVCTVVNIIEKSTLISSDSTRDLSEDAKNESIFLKRKV